MLKSDAKLKKLASVFNNSEKELIVETIELLRNDVPFKGVIGLLTSLYDRTDEDDIRRVVETFMNDIKEQSATPEVIAEIKRGWKQETNRMLVASCWQSGLHYSSYIQDFTEVFLRSDYLTSFECLTVIEESVHEISKNIKVEIIKKIEQNHFPPEDEKAALATELISILKY